MNTSWYLHRLRAMSLEEMVLHARKKANQKIDLLRQPRFDSSYTEVEAAFPKLPEGEPPPEFKEALAQDVERILSGRVRFFAQLDLPIELPPRWHKDYLVGADLENNDVGFRINHRKLAGGAEIKLIWELSRWYFLVRLAEGAAVLNNRRAGEECLRLLSDWSERNQPFHGWNWTSALETGMRLIQITWIDRFLERAGMKGQLDPLLAKLLGPHVYFSWRYRTFGSSANNHLLGELAGLAVALGRWRDLERFAAPLSTIHTIWEREVLLQFAEDGGNREQALNYHLFSFEFCWQTRLALKAAGLKISARVEERLQHAAEFFRRVQTPDEPWDYGDSDNAYVTPVFANEPRFMQEWLAWFNRQPEGASIKHWMGEPPSAPAQPSSAISEKDGWTIFQETGIAQRRSGQWLARWDVSPLGFLQTAAHGHLDALHLTLWRAGQAFVIDPGTGAYFIGGKLRDRIAGWEGHNGPQPVWGDWPRRAGPFLWAEHHPNPGRENWPEARLEWPQGIVKRKVTAAPNDDGFVVEDTVLGKGNAWPHFQIHWHFAPEVIAEQIGDRRVRLSRGGNVVMMELDPNWTGVTLLQPPGFTPTLEQYLAPATTAREQDTDWRSTVCSRAYRQLICAPVLRLVYQGSNPCVLRTAFSGSPK